MTPSNCCYDGISDVDAPRPVAFDYDGDGRTELAMTVSYRLLSLTNSERVRGGASLRSLGTVWRDYEAGEAHRTRRDTRRRCDGRPDLIEQDQHETCPPDPCEPRMRLLPRRRARDSFGSRTAAELFGRHPCRLAADRFVAPKM